MTRKALIVGIDFHTQIPQLFGCVNDSFEVKGALERHTDGSVNFHVKHLTSNSSRSPITRQALRDSIVDLFSGDSDIALLYFAGHGHIESVGGFLCAKRRRRSFRHRDAGQQVKG